jgi:hypothetical protein
MCQHFNNGNLLILLHVPFILGSELRHSLLIPRRLRLLWEFISRRKTNPVVMGEELLMHLCNFVRSSESSGVLQATLLSFITPQGMGSSKSHQNGLSMLTLVNSII